MSEDRITRARGIALASLILLGCEDDIVIYDDFSSLSGEWTSTWEYWQAGPTSWVLTLEEHGKRPTHRNVRHRLQLQGGRAPAGHASRNGEGGLLQPRGAGVPRLHDGAGERSTSHRVL